MTTWTADRRAMAVAHLGDLMNAALLGGYEVRARRILQAINFTMTDGSTIHELHYRLGLEDAGVVADDIEASVTAINEGRHPADSIPGRVAKYRDEKEAMAAKAPTTRRGLDVWLRVTGKEQAARWVLELLGCESIRS